MVYQNSDTFQLIDCLHVYVPLQRCGAHGAPTGLGRGRGAGLCDRSSQGNSPSSQLQGPPTTGRVAESPDSGVCGLGKFKEPLDKQQYLLTLMVKSLTTG